MKQMKLGSLFDGSGTCLLAASMCGIEPIWASEIEPYPIAVTREHFPMVEHLGSITDIDGAKITPVDIITGGSPCQDLSVAGKQMGLHDGQRSNLFFEMIRVIKEMRKSTNGDYPRYVMWENVPGAFSSNKGDDFRCVLEEFCKITDESASIPRPKKWSNAGEIVGNGYSIVWRVLDSQYWGVPQRRKRIYLVADFTGGDAGEILFEPESVRRDSTPGRTAREGTAGDAERGVGGGCGVRCLNPWDCQSKRIFEIDGVYPTLPAMDGGGANNQAVIYPVGALCAGAAPAAGCVAGEEKNNLMLYDKQAIGEYGCNGKASTLTASLFKSVGDIVVQVFHCQQDPISSPDVAPCIGGQGQATVGVCAAFMGRQGVKAGGIGYQEEISPTLKSTASGGNTVPTLCYCLQGNGIDRADTAGCNGRGWRDGEMYTLNTIDRPAVCYTLDSTGGNSMKSANPKSGFHETNIARCLDGSSHDPTCNQGGNVVVYDARGNGDGKTVPTITGDHQKSITDYTSICCEIRDYSVGGYSEYSKNNPCLRASGGDNGGGSETLIVYKFPRKYIVRRLTPTECARLQGFPDYWGRIPHKIEFTTDETKYWQNVRKTYLTANGKKYSPISSDSLLKWYNKLHTDSSEYKMWGNGMTLPCVAFVIDRICKQNR